MGAWGNRNFENDGAMDWLNDFLVSPSSSKLEQPFSKVLEQEEFIDSDESFETLAAAEIIAAKKGKRSADFPDDIDIQNDLSFIMNPTLNTTAITAIEKILYFPKHSELRELWQETNEYEKWVAIQKDLIKRLG